MPNKTKFALSLPLVLLAMMPESASSSTPAEKHPLQLTVFISNQAPVVGEPITLTYRLSNLDSQSIYMTTSGSKDDWLNLEVIDSVGNAVSRVPDNTPKYFTRFRPIPRSVANGQTTSEDALVLTREFRLNRQGLYRVKVSVNVECRTNDGKAIDPLVVKFNLPIHLRRATANSLRRIADQVAGNCVEGAGRTQSHIAIQQLLSMPEEVWAPIVRTMIGRRGVPQLWLKQELQRLGSPGALTLTMMMSRHDNETQRKRANGE